MPWEQHRELKQLAGMLQAIYASAIREADWPPQEELTVLIEYRGGASVQITVPRAGILPDWRTGDLRGIRIAHAIYGFSPN